MSRIEALRAEHGAINPRAVEKVKDFLEPFVQGFIRNAPFAVLSTSSADGDCDASPKGGLPGFIKVVDERTLLIPDIGGNRLFQSFLNIEANPKAGLLFMIPGVDVTVRVNGRVDVLDKTEMDARGMEPELLNPDGNSGMIQGLLLTVDEAYFHCPRAYKFSELWNPEQIARNAARSLKDLE